MKIFGLSIVFLSALALSVLAATISIIGMMALFPSDGIMIAVMMGTLEASKLVAATWLHSNWHNKAVSILHKIYLSLAVVSLMLITAIGIYGYLAKGYLDQQSPISTTNIQIATREQQIKTLQDNIKGLNDRQAQLDASVNALITQNQIVKSQTYRNQQKTERAQIAKDLDSDQKEIDRITQELVPMKIATTNVELKLGPIKYVADLFGWKNPDAAVRMVILMIMFAFDPLAIMLILSGSISMRKSSDIVVEKPIVPIVEHKHTIQKIEIPPVSESDDMSDKQAILNILQRNPNVIEEMLDTVIEWHDKPKE